MARCLHGDDLPTPGYAVGAVGVPYREAAALCSHSELFFGCIFSTVSLVALRARRGELWSRLPPWSRASLRKRSRATYSARPLQGLCMALLHGPRAAAAGAALPPHVITQVRPRVQK